LAFGNAVVNVTEVLVESILVTEAVFNELALRVLDED
jgi:hypothetical protein